MEQSSAQLNDDVNSPCRDTISTSGVLVRVPLLVARSFEGLSPKLVVGVPRRRRILTGDPDPETASGPVDAFPLQVRRVNRAEPPSHEDEASPHTGTPAQQSCIIDLTVNRLCRIKTIMVLGFWGGWSPIPAEPRVPVSATWVTYICIITDW
jgi:hypothetical protein